MAPIQGGLPRPRLLTQALGRSYFPRTLCRATLPISFATCVLVPSGFNCTQRCAAGQAPRSVGFSRQEQWSELPSPSPGDLPLPGTEPGSPVYRVSHHTVQPSPRNRKVFTGYLLNQ